MLRARIELSWGLVPSKLDWALRQHFLAMAPNIQPTLNFSISLTADRAIWRSI